METKTTQCHPKPVVNATCLLGEKGCYKNGKCHYIGNCEHKVLTNADRIRAMSDEELAEWMAECNAYKENADASQWLPWLKQPAE